MKYALVQFQKPYRASANVFEYCFIVVLTNMTLEEATAERNKLEHPDHYIIIQVF